MGRTCSWATGLTKLQEDKLSHGQGGLGMVLAAQSLAWFFQSAAWGWWGREQAGRQSS